MSSRSKRRPNRAAKDPETVVWDVDRRAETFPVDHDHLARALKGAGAPKDKDVPYSLCRDIEAYARDKWRNWCEENVRGLKQLALAAGAKIASIADQRALLLDRLRSAPATVPVPNAAAEPWTSWAVGCLVALLAACGLILFLDAVTIEDILVATRAAYAERPWVAWVLSIFLGLVACALKVGAHHVPFFKRHEGALNLGLSIAGAVCLLAGGGMTLLAELGGAPGADSMDIFAAGAPSAGMGAQAVIGRCLLIVAAMCAVGLLTSMIHRLVSSHGRPTRDNPEFLELKRQLRDLDENLAHARRESAVVEPLEQAMRRGEDNYARRTMAALYELHVKTR